MIKQSLDLCIKTQVHEFIHCKDLFSPIEVLLQSTFIKLDSLSHIIASDSPHRYKRSIEVGGELLKFLFGTLDADDARKYDAAINACQSNEKELFNLMKENIHIVKSTVTSFNSTLTKLNKNENRLNLQIEHLNDVISQTSQTNNNLLYISKINNLVNIIEGSLLAVSNSLETILNSILFAKTNVLHPSVITPSNLLKELIQHNNIMNKRLDFPLPLNLETIHTLIDISTLTVYYYNKRIVFIMQIPLISPVKYVVYKLIPLPTPHDSSKPSTFVLVHPTKPYLAITEDRLNYALLDNINQCLKITNDYSICTLTSIQSTNSNPCCETKLLTEVVLSLPNECDKRLLYGRIDIWQRINDNKWIYVQSNNNKLTVKCGDDIKDYPIIGTGLLKLTSDCIGYSKTLQFIPSTTTTFTYKNQFVIDFDITQDDCCRKEMLNKTIPLLSPLSLSNIDLDSLQHASNQLDHLEKEMNNYQEQSHFVKYVHYYSGFTYFIVTLIFIIIIYKLYAYCRRNKNHNNGLCCVQIFNQCNTKRIARRETNINNSIEMTEISTSETSDDASNVSYTSNRNLSNN